MKTLRVWKCQGCGKEEKNYATNCHCYDCSESMELTLRVHDFVEHGPKHHELSPRETWALCPQCNRMGVRMPFFDDKKAVFIHLVHITGKDDRKVKDSCMVTGEKAEGLDSKIISKEKQDGEIHQTN